MRILAALAILLIPVFTPGVAASFGTNGVCTWIELENGLNGCETAPPIWPENLACSLWAGWAVDVAVVPGVVEIDSGWKSCPGGAVPDGPFVIWPASWGVARMTFLQFDSATEVISLWRERTCDSEGLVPAFGDQVTCVTTSDAPPTPGLKWRVIVEIEHGACAEVLQRCDWLVWFGIWKS